MNYFDGGHWLYLDLPSPSQPRFSGSLSAQSPGLTAPQWPFLTPDQCDQAFFPGREPSSAITSAMGWIIVVTTNKIWSLLQAKTQFWNRLRPNVDHGQVSPLVTDYTHSPHRMSPNHSYTVNPDTNHSLSHDPSSRPSSNVRCGLSPEPTQTNLIQTQSDK